jgi:hypothetical protein
MIIGLPKHEQTDLGSVAKKVVQLGGDKETGADGLPVVAFNGMEYIVEVEMVY